MRNFISPEAADSHLVAVGTPPLGFIPHVADTLEIQGETGSLETLLSTRTSPDEPSYLSIMGVQCPPLFKSAAIRFSCKQKDLKRPSQSNGCLRFAASVSSAQTPRSDHLDLREAILSRVSNFTPYLQSQDNYSVSVSAQNRHESVYTHLTILINKLWQNFLYTRHFAKCKVIKYKFKNQNVFKTMNKTRTQPLGSHSFLDNRGLQRRQEKEGGHRCLQLYKAQLLNVKSD